MLYEMTGALHLPQGTKVVDVGCGDGRHALQLAGRFGFRVTAIDPVEYQVAMGRTSLKAAEEEHPGIADRVVFSVGDASQDLVWCRDVLSHVVRLDDAYGEFWRVLRPGGHALIYQSVFVTERFGPADESMHPLDVPSSADPACAEAAIAVSGFSVSTRIEVGSEWGEHLQETTGEPGRRLLHAARLLRDPERYISKYGPEMYRLMVADCMWHIFRMIGKLSGRIYLLSKPGSAA